MSSSHGTNGSAMSNGGSAIKHNMSDEHLELNIALKNLRKDEKYAKFHGDTLIGEKVAPKGFIADMQNSADDFYRIFTMKNMPTIMRILGKVVTFQGFDMKAAAPLVGSMSNDSHRRRALLEKNVKAKYEKMLHPPLTYLGDAFQYRTPDGKFNNVLSPHLGQAGAPYAKTVPSKTHPLGALPDPGDLFDRLMARQEGGRQSQSGLSSMLIYHATIIIHDIFRTNENDKNISDSSSYLDLSPLYGYTMEMQRKVRDGKYKLGLLKPDTFAEDRLLRQPPGVCIMLVMYNRYHNFAATQLRRINENGRFSVPSKYQGTLLEAVARKFGADIGMLVTQEDKFKFAKECEHYNAAWKDVQARQPDIDSKENQDKIKDIRGNKGLTGEKKKEEIDKLTKQIEQAQLDFRARHKEYQIWTKALEDYMPNIDQTNDYVKKLFKDGTEMVTKELTKEQIKELTKEKTNEMIEEEIKKQIKKQRDEFEAAYHAAWDKLDDDLFNTARLITCGMYIQVSIHDYLRALMGFHQWNTNFTLEPRSDIDNHSVSRGIGNQVTVEFNLLYRFHCAISLKDEAYTKKFMKKTMGVKNPDDLSLEDFLKAMRNPPPKVEPSQSVFGIPGEPGLDFTRDPITGLFDDQTMIDALTASMNDPISNFGPCNVPKCLKSVEIMGIVQARNWQIGTLNDFREFFQMPRHETFESVTKSVEVQNALRDLYEHPDKIELYPGVFCESDDGMGMDPGPSDVDSALWAAIFSDAITLVRSDRFYTTDWNTNSLTSWGMKEVTSDNDTCKSSVFHRLIQRAFPGWFPYNSVQFFHPFYTAQTNARFASEQGYAPEFRMSPKAKPSSSEDGTSEFGVEKSSPQKPWKPVYLSHKDTMLDILEDKINLVHPAFNDPANFPKCFAGMFKQAKTGSREVQPKLKENKEALMTYFTDLMKDIIKRESIPMNSATLQIDATRDFAIPVVTTYIADFLGFGHLLRNQKHPKAPHTENEIYQHIENCQIFLSYNSDETKLLKRRRAFKASLQVLHDLVLKGNLGDAHRWSLGRYFFGTPKDNPMTQLGFEVAERVLQHQPNLHTAASVMVFVGLSTAYNAVLGFTSALNLFLDEMYSFANPHLNPGKKLSGKPKWLEVQALAHRKSKESQKELKKLVIDAERRSIKLPVVLVAKEKKEYDHVTVEKGYTVICDIFKANDQVYRTYEENAKNHRIPPPAPKKTDFIAHNTSATDQFADYQPKRVADLSVAAMIKIFAQMRNPRRGHDAQGRLKKIRIDSSAEGYSNYMAPMRIERISKQVEIQPHKHDATKIYTSTILRPETNIYLTAEWNEMVPFPNTWKIRFDGFGYSDYSAMINDKNDPYGKLRQQDIPDDTPPFYQPRGSSHTGGTFADVSCVCTAAGVIPVVERKDNKVDVTFKKEEKAAKKAPAFSTGCGYSQ